MATLVVVALVGVLFLSACDTDNNEEDNDALTWTQLRSATYPSALQPGTDISLTDGIAESPVSDGGTYPAARLADIGAFGEIDSGRSIDSAVFLTEATGPDTWVTSLVVVLNDDGAPLAQNPFPLGENVAVVGVTINDQEITTRVRALGSYDASAGTTNEITRISKLDGDSLTIEGETTEQVVTASPDTFEFEPAVIDAAAGSETRSLTLDPRRSALFFVAASEGQQLELTAVSEFDTAILSVQGLTDDTTLVDQSAYSTSFSGPVPATQTYSVRVLSVAGDSLDVQFDYSLTGEAAPPEPVPTPAPPPPTTELGAAVPKSPLTELGPERTLAALSQPAADFIPSRAPARGIAVVTAEQGLVYTENGDEQLETASVIKVVVMVCTMLRAEQQGRLVDEWELSLMWPMITYSDNDATDALWTDLGGGPGIAACLQSIGATGITPFMGTYWGTSTASARGMAELMGRIAFGSVVNDVHRAVALKMLTSVIAEQRWGVPAGADDSGNEIVGVKDGWYPDDDGWRVNSVGFISPVTPGGQAYAIAVMTNNQTTQEYGIETIEGLALPVYEALRPTPWHPRELTAEVLEPCSHWRSEQRLG